MIPTTFEELCESERELAVSLSLKYSQRDLVQAHTFALNRFDRSVYFAAWCLIEENMQHLDVSVNNLLSSWNPALN